MKSTLKGKEILSLDLSAFEDDEEPIAALRFSDFFKSLSRTKQIAILEAHGREVEKDIALSEDPRRLKSISAEDLEYR